ncbi:MAG: Prodigiosin synthesizing transferase PigC [Phycisphaerae bacterium]|nr:Prodigiosin synthesizing transferase PigC [Phycisphaerae bacterium]
MSNQPQNSNVGNARSCIRPFGLGVKVSQIPGLTEVGGKGTNLFKLTAAEFPVPGGYVIDTGAYRRFITAGGLVGRIGELAAQVDENDVEGLGRIAGSIREMFANTPMPDDLAAAIKEAYGRVVSAGMGDRIAVRSSATAEDLPEASFAGQQDTYLNIGGEESLLRAVKSCWGSLWTDRAVAYRAKHNVPVEGLAMAVVVQLMVKAEASGVMFTANPVTGSADEIVINATWGLGEAIVGGHVTPDMIVVDKSTGKVKEITVSEKTVMTAETEHGTEEVELTGDRRNARVLDDAAVAELAEIGRRIEAHYGSSQDIEWAVAGGRFAMLQARPIQGLEVAQDVEIGRKEEIARLEAIAGDHHRVWVIYNLDETMAHPTPMTWDLMKHFMSGDGGFGQMYRDFGYQPSEVVCKEGFLELICGHVYADPKRNAGLFWSQVPMEYNIEQVLEDPATMEQAPNKLNMEEADPAFFLRLPGWIWAMIRCGRRMKKARRQARIRFENEWVPRLEEFLAQAAKTDLAKMTPAQLIEELDRRRQFVLTEFGGESLKPGFFGGMAQGTMQALLTQLMGQVKGDDLTRTLTMGLEGDVTIEQNIVLYRVARGQMTLKQFMDRFGHRASGEMELAEPRWREQTDYIEQMVQTFSSPTLKSPEERHREQSEARAKAEEALPETLTHWGGASLYEKIVDEMKTAQELLPYRETGKFHLMRGYEAIRAVLLELDRRWELDGGVFFLHLDELSKFESDRSALAEQIRKRKVRWQSAKKLTMPEVIDSHDLEELGLMKASLPAEAPIAASTASASELKGKPIASGMATGTARIVFDPKTAGNLGDSYILVCPSTDPGWTPLFVNARGLIVERGGILSHGAIVARDFGIPAVVCENATKLLRDGGRITVDGTRGVIIPQD